MKMGTGQSLSIMVAVSLTGWLLVTQDAVGGLYQCRTAEGLIYTDTPAQLTQCVPIDQRGETSRVGVVGRSVMEPVSPPAVVPLPPQPQSGSPSTSDTSQAVSPLPSIPPSEALPSAPCVPGINPFNPLTAPPCPTTEASPPAASAVPADQNALPLTPVQP